ncbi:hypothetical protein C8R48DRAFT_90695 [Suillus tomentosus]|nr:hypothetical protein C8R48DRAFT_90695 [Suillus tomentosus]
MQRCHAESQDIISRLHVNGNIAGADKVSYAQKDFHQMVKHVEMCLHACIAVGGARQMYSKASYRKRMMIGFFANTLPKLLGVMTTWLICITTWALTGYWFRSSVHYILWLQHWRHSSHPLSWISLDECVSLVCLFDHFVIRRYSHWND